MARDRLSVFNDTLLYLHQTPIATVTDDCEARVTISAVWDEALRFVIEEGNWNFAQKTEALTYDNTLTPAPGFLYVIQKPALWYRTVWLKQSYNSYDEIEYLDEGAVWFTNYQTVVARWIDAAYIADDYIPAWPAAFVAAFIRQIAIRVGGHLTGGDSDLEQWKKDYKDAMTTARNFDLMQEPNVMARPPGLWRRAMGSRYGSRENWR